MTARGERRAAAVLFDWLVSQRDADGLVAVRTTGIAQATGLRQSSVEVLLCRFASIGAVPVIRRGGQAGPSVRRPLPERRGDAVGVAATLVGKDARGADVLHRALLVPQGPPMRAPDAVRTRCPFCNLPPLDGDCRHGWNGLTTRAQRRMILDEHVAASAADGRR